MRESKSSAMETTPGLVATRMIAVPLGRISSVNTSPTMTAAAQSIVVQMTVAA